jgi:photosystem II stability/assembly factor-like uncharacterized protein
MIKFDCTANSIFILSNSSIYFKKSNTKKGEFIMRIKITSLPKLAFISFIFINTFVPNYLSSLILTGRPLSASFTNCVIAQPLDMEKLHGLKARSIGPAGMSGRITSIDVVLKDPSIIYVGTASGGLWRSKGSGVDWEPLFDDQPVASIGALAIDQKIPDVIWVGTGEGNPRNSQTSGNGVYKSLDAGKTWTHLGLENTRNIHRIIVHPHNSDIVYVAAQGSAWVESEERGIYKTINGGKTWEKILFVNERTGAADFVIDLSNPNKLIAAMWEFRRWPWFFKSGGGGSGIYVTFDGGKTWTKRTSKDGLPKGELGRIGLAISNNSPNVIYALIESKKNALYRSDDGGFTWNKINDKDVGNRPFYYSEIYIDPKNENRIYDIATYVRISEDGGRTFENISSLSKIHVDHHAWWIHPENPDFIIDGNDGGLAISYDKGKSWKFIENLPLGQFYHINIDMEFPYNVYGGLQDNGSWKGPSRLWRSGGIRNTYWESIGGGDGFDVLPDKSNSRYGYSMSQGGWLYKYDSETGYQKLIRPIHPDGKDLRFNWNAGIAHDPFDLTTIYYGSQYLHRSTNRGDAWEIISPDLTKNDPEKQKQLESGGLTYDVTNAENFTTIISIAPSPVKRGTIWVGTDDGNLQLTTDDGKSWTNLITNIKGVPEETWIPQIQASSRNAGEAFVVFDNHRKDDWTPYVFHTKDFGKTWKNLAEGKNIFGYSLSFAQDHIEPNLMFLGTEFGLYISIDGGKNWTKWKNGFPTVSTMDMVVHPRESDLVIGTFGRSVYILDNIQPLRILAKDGIEVLKSKIKIFNIPDAYLAVYNSAPGVRNPGDAVFEGTNLPSGAMITFNLNVYNKEKNDENKLDEREKENSDRRTKDSSEVKIEVFNPEGELIRTLKVTAKNGINRTYWDLDRKGVRFPNQPKPKPGERERGGPPVLPGKYLVKVSIGDFADSTYVNVKPDPRLTITTEDLSAREKTLNKVIEKINITTETMDKLRDAQKNLKFIDELLKEKDDESSKMIKSKSKSLQDTIKYLTGIFYDEDVQGIRRDPKKIGSRLSTTYRYVVSSWETPPEMAEISLMQFSAQLSEAVKKINSFFSNEWMDFSKLVEEAKISLIENPSPIKIE